MDYGWDKNWVQGCVHRGWMDKIEIDTSVELVKLPKESLWLWWNPSCEEIQTLVDREITAPVDCSLDWKSGMVSVQKQNGKPRICIDRRPLNKAGSEMKPLSTADYRWHFAGHVKSKSFYRMWCKTRILGCKVSSRIELPTTFDTQRVCGNGLRCKTMHSKDWKIR